MIDIYLVSDTHFGQRFAIKYFKRPFKNVEEMHIKLIDNWNSKVDENDIIIILGDFYAGSKTFSKYLLDNLNGEKILIKGNHDYKRRYRKLLGMEKIKIYNEIQFSIDGYNFLLTHKPLKRLPEESFNIHGHLHRKVLSSKYDQDKYFNVGVDHNAYKPIPLEDIVEDKIGTDNINPTNIINQIENVNVNQQSQLLI